MDSSINKHQKNLAAFVHISTFAKYFFPFGNFIIPLILWTSNKNESDYIDHHGKQALNFQISILLYSMALGIIAIPVILFTSWDFIGFADIFEHNTHHFDLDFDNGFRFRGGLAYLGIAGVLALGLFVLDIYCTITATIRANEGVLYRYPLTINFIK
ncbi:DUF4870 domain-containing protein [Leptobacterium flavescens]|uniref:DUF4870 domain-containing protein n=1 Tax=Leptobacterium flavescens TaxID=472055 RepID=A0A6P0ULH4_9FLAO|nr:DUF4870 domain-containing protein [Leptobacterium flavescens]NER14105.1 DUF4870 domain-containing protein [Leptobacterium flavescens]